MTVYIMASQIVGASESFQLSSFVRGYHEYQHLWTPRIGEVLVVKQERDNRYDKHAFAVLMDASIVGHVPREICKNVYYFLNHDGNLVFCKAAGDRCNQGAGCGVEIPCVFKFYGHQMHVIKLKELLTADS